MGLVAKRVRVFGRVQGVFFRAFTRDVAESLHVAGTVRNCDDGSVEAYLEGDEKAVEKMIDFLRMGPPAAQVEGIEVEVVQPVGMKGPFTILR